MLCESKFRGAIGCWWWAGLLGSPLSHSGPGHWAGSLQEHAHPSPPAACWPRGRRPAWGTLLDGSGQWQRATGKGPAPPRTPGRSRGGDLRTALGPARPAPPQSPGSGSCCSACGLGVDGEREIKLKRGENQQSSNVASMRQSRGIQKQKERAEAGWAGERAEGEKREEARKQFCIVLNVQFVPKVRAFMKFQTLA